MPCVPAPVRLPAARLPVAGLPVAGLPSARPPADAFAFSPASGAAARTVENVAALWSAPWIAFWALAMESLDPANYRL